MLCCAALAVVVVVGVCNGPISPCLLVVAFGIL